MTTPDELQVNPHNESVELPDKRTGLGKQVVSTTSNRTLTSPMSTALG